MKIRCLVLVLLSAVLLSEQLNAQQPPLQVVPEIDYQKYAGKWFEIARLPNRFEEDCVANVTAEYTPRPDGRITVVNRCEEADGGINVAEGVARREDGAPPSVLEVRFAPAFLSLLPMVWGDYRIIELDPDYRYAVVGSDDREYLWVLSRTPHLDDATYDAAVAAARSQGFDVSRLIRTKQS
jgi:apolipoprotein D and lipocalin family protein